jgi:FixJ family two-component response regulator
MRSVKDFSPFVAVVDDNAPLREAIESLLESAGYRARGYESAEAFLCSTAARRAACLILDANPVPVIFISAHDEIESGLKARALQLGALAFLHKPFGGDDLLRVVDNAMQLCNQRQ